MKLASITFEGQKKKSSRYIIPASYFVSTIVEERLDIPQTDIDKTPITDPIPTSSLVMETSEKYTAASQHKVQIKEPETEEPEKIQLNKVVRRKSALSLSSIKRDKVEEEKIKSKQKVVENLEDLPKDPFSEEKFLEIWFAYIESQHQEGEKIFASILKADVPKIKNTMVHLTYPNEMMKAELNKVKFKALKHLRKELNNYAIDFEISVNEENVKKFAYTPQEKYDLLKSKNEAIAKLKNTFNLEL